MSPQGFNDAIAALPKDTKYVRVAFHTAFGFPQHIATYPTPAPLERGGSFAWTRVELKLPSNATWRVSCYDIERLEPVLLA